jgi:hypothetical protein
MATTRKRTPARRRTHADNARKVNRKEADTAQESSSFGTTWEGLVKRLAFSNETILQDTASQPGLFIKAAEYRITCLRRLLRTKVQADAAEAQAGFRARGLLESRGEKTTEKRVQELVCTDQDYMDEQEARQQATIEEEASKLLVEAYRHRRDCLKLVVEMVSSEVSLQTAVETGQAKLERARKNIKEKYRGAE